MTTAAETPIEIMLRELEVTNPEETATGTWPSPRGPVRVSLIHQTGHVYSTPAAGPAQEPAVLYRLPVEEIGLEACIKAVDSLLQKPEEQDVKQCDTPGCNNPAGPAVSIAPATYVAICGFCRQTLY